LNFFDFAEAPEIFFPGWGFVERKVVLKPRNVSEELIFELLPRKLIDQVMCQKCLNHLPFKGIAFKAKIR
jgi:hypothetical protein